jgi:hypothetical protein
MAWCASCGRRWRRARGRTPRLRCSGVRTRMRSCHSCHNCTALEKAILSTILSERFYVWCTDCWLNELQLPLPVVHDFLWGPEILPSTHLIVLFPSQTGGGSPVRPAWIVFDRVAHRCDLLFGLSTKVDS